MRSERNAPKNVVYTARFIAGRIGIREEELATVTTRNARNLFGLPLEVEASRCTRTLQRSASASISLEGSEHRPYSRGGGDGGRRRPRGRTGRDFADLPRREGETVIRDRTRPGRDGGGLRGPSGLRQRHRSRSRRPPLRLRVAPVPPNKLVANLPYNVASPLVLRLLEEVRGLHMLRFMVRLEVARRMAASPGTKDYGAYAVLVQLLAEVEVAHRVSPNVFRSPAAGILRRRGDETPQTWSKARRVPGREGARARRVQEPPQAAARQPARRLEDGRLSRPSSSWGTVPACEAEEGSPRRTSWRSRRGALSGET